ncbi:MAG: PEP-CTERM sorting domain-containing protein [Planctomycetaceae bacterium]|nr:PEP-CTERM sorting domain-containing protein [Planctomycetaceae bacterium]
MSFAATAAPRSFGAFDDSPSTPAYQSTNNDRSFEESEEGEGGKDGPPTPPTTPEPATLLIIGMSLAGLAPLVRRYRREQTSH